VHEHGIAHRDIKPDNLLRGKDGFIKFVDFGVSEMFEPGQDRSKKSAGSPAFFSPEMCTAQHGEMSTKACDIWALGVTLHCLCFGKLPFVGHTILELYENIRTLQLEIPECSPELKDLLTKMMMKDPKQRITLSEIRVRFPNFLRKPVQKSKAHKRRIIHGRQTMAKNHYCLALKTWAKTWLKASPRRNCALQSSRFRCAVSQRFSKQLPS